MTNPAKLLTHHKLRVTVARLGVLELFQTHARLAPKEIYRLLDREDRTTSIATIHRVLVELCEAGLVERHFLGTGTASYSLCQTGTGAHQICQRCGEVQTCSDQPLQALLGALSESHGFALLEATVSLRGVCAACTALRQARAGG